MKTARSRLSLLILAFANYASAQEGQLPQVTAAEHAIQSDQPTAEGNAAAQANNPLANTKALNFHNYYIGEFTGLDEYGDQVFVRYAQPFSIGESLWLMRATLPINTYPNGTNHDTGIGDFNAFAAYLFDTGDPALSIGLGPQITAPTATEDNLGSEKWSAGFAHVLFNGKSKKIQYGYLLTWQASFAGEDSRRDVNAGAFQPFTFLQLGGGNYLRSSAVMVYDFESDDYTIPLGLGFGKVIPTDQAVINLFVEPQYSVLDRGDAYPQWQIFTGLNFQF
ncbi:hypothetical protein ACFPK9_05325 [Rubritalea spongiae]|uniref:Transporter n=1 Tax=Rubritalea spongiae TaxID=430797 RepID=A0ABW5E661_9BACT